MNYTELTTAIQSYTENSFPTTLSTIVKQAERRIYKSCLFPNLRATDTSKTLTTGTATVAVPSDFIAPFSTATIDPTTGAYTFLLFKDTNYIREAYPIPAATAAPRVYSILGGTANKAPLQFIIGPTPDKNYQLELQYFQFPESIVTATNTWLGDNFDDALLYGCLLEAYTEMKGDEDLMKIYQARYDEALALAKKFGDGMDRGDAYLYGQARNPVT